jgi:hypothetical protein
MKNTRKTTAIAAGAVMLSGAVLGLAGCGTTATAKTLPAAAVSMGTSRAASDITGHFLGILEHPVAAPKVAAPANNRGHQGGYRIGSIIPARHQYPGRQVS